MLSIMSNHPETVRIWDIPTRLFHWLFATACVTAWLTGDKPRYTDLHLFAGYLALGLVLFRLVWGISGGRYARFVQFVRGPRAVGKHLAGLFTPQEGIEPGHNPAGGWAIVLMLTLVLLLGVSGLVVLGAEEGFGPLAGMFSIELGVTVHHWHDWLAWTLLAVVVMHLSGVILESLIQRQNLPLSMMTGNKVAAREAAEICNAEATGWAMVLVITIFSALWFFPYTQASDDQPYLPFVGAELTQNPYWQESCSECHMAYHPALLPLRSWERMFIEQDDHFGEDLFLSTEIVSVLRDFAQANSADKVAREKSWRTVQSLESNESPLRITETPFWKQAHQRIDEVVWHHPEVNSKINCAACHHDARQGGFLNGAMRLPELKEARGREAER